MYRGWYTGGLRTRAHGRAHRSRGGRSPRWSSCDATTPSRPSMPRVPIVVRTSRVAADSTTAPSSVRFHGHRVELSEASSRRTGPALSHEGARRTRLRPPRRSPLARLRRVPGRAEPHAPDRPGFTLTRGRRPSWSSRTDSTTGIFRLVHGLEAVSDLTLDLESTASCSWKGLFSRARACPGSAARATARSPRFWLLIRVFSPALCVTEPVDGHDCYQVISGATPRPTAGARSESRSLSRRPPTRPA
jgi:hypothetical protein